MCAICAKDENLIFDTDILIWALRSNDKARAALFEADKVIISAVTYMEVMQGMINKRELAEMKKFLSQLDAEIMLITPEITQGAMDYVERYALSHSMELADALIAATCIKNGEPLCTANEKHYRQIAELNLQTFYP